MLRNSIVSHVALQKRDIVNISQLQVGEEHKVCQAIEHSSIKVDQHLLVPRLNFHQALTRFVTEQVQQVQ